MKKIKLYLCGPGSVHPFAKHTNGLGFLQSNCETKDWNIDIVLDANELKDCDMIGLSCEASGITEAIEIQKHSNVPVIIGGQISLWEKLSNYPFDKIVRGEGEIALRDILEGKCEDEQFIQRPYIQDLDTLKFPTRRFYNNKIYCITARGCPFKCRFCASVNYWGKPRWHSAEYFIDDIMQTIKQHPTANLVHVLDDLFILDQKRLEKIHGLWMKHNLHKKFKLFNVAIRPQVFNRTIASLLKEMGLLRLRMGIESLSPSVLEILGKKQTEEDLQEIIDIAREMNVQIGTYFMHGVPGETPEDIAKSNKFIQKNLDIILPLWVKYQPLPGIAMYDGTNPLNQNMVVKSTARKAQKIINERIKDIKL